MRLIVKTPIHIGSGEAIKPLSYIIDGGWLYVINSEKFFNMLSERQRETYLEWIDPILERLAELDNKIFKARDNQDERRRLQRQRRKIEDQLSLEWFITNRLRLNKTQVANECASYSVRFTAQPGRDGFKAHIKDAQNNVYIPGTEIKGAVRASLIYMLLQGNESRRKLLDIPLTKFKSSFVHQIDKVRKIKDKDERREEEKRLKGQIKKELGEISKNLERVILRGLKGDVKFDSLKLIQISDTNSFPSNEVLQIQSFKVVGSAHNIPPTFIEVLIPPQEFEFNFTIRTEEILFKELGLEGLKSWLSREKILEACYQRSRDILEEEKKYFASEPAILKQLNELEKENTLSSPLLRLGAGQGFLGTTIDLRIKQNDPLLYDEAIRKGVSFLRGWRTQKGNFPKTRRVITDSSNNLISLLGWVKLRD